MDRKVNANQLAVLRWIADGCPEDRLPSENYKQSAVALANRRLVQISKRQGRWRATMTDAGRHFLDHGDYPSTHFLAQKPAMAPPVAPNTLEAPASANARGRDDRTPPAKATAVAAVIPPPPEVDSPARVRRRGYRPRGDGLRGDARDPWDERVLISVKEAAWLLSVSEGMIRQAVADGDVDRVYIGAGTTHYRVVYGSLLAWVNAMPRQSAVERWWY